MSNFFTHSYLRRDLRAHQYCHHLFVCESAIPVGPRAWIVAEIYVVMKKNDLCVGGAKKKKRRFVAGFRINFKDALHVCHKQQHHTQHHTHTHTHTCAHTHTHTHTHTHLHSHIATSHHTPTLQSLDPVKVC